MKSEHIEEGRQYYWMNGPVMELVTRMDGYFCRADGSIADVRTEDHIVPVSASWYERRRKRR